tara:strand:+ start:41 stop:367 length:327 start_codon:yes stop_codon:yes gene_type:complete
MKIKNTFIILLLSIILISCQGAKDAFQTKKRSSSNQEFLIEKKKPLTAPPDMNKLPTPASDVFDDEGIEEEVSQVKKILEITEDQPNTDSSLDNNSSLEQSIIEKINN